MATSKHYRHLNLEDRKAIENSVIEGRTLAWTSEKIGVDATSISRELKRNRRDDGFVRSMTVHPNQCARRKTCRVRTLCDPDCRKKCSVCRKVRCADLRSFAVARSSL